jgi:hypothetical protein
MWLPNTELASTKKRPQRELMTLRPSLECRFGVKGKDGMARHDLWTRASRGYRCQVMADTIGTELCQYYELAE